MQSVAVVVAAVVADLFDGHAAALGIDLIDGAVAVVVERVVTDLVLVFGAAQTALVGEAVAVVVEAVADLGRAAADDAALVNVTVAVVVDLVGAELHRRRARRAALVDLAVAVVVGAVADLGARLASFQDYYEGTTIAEDVDPQRLYELQAETDAAHVYYKPEVDQFARVFFKPKAQQSPADNRRMNAALDPAVDRFDALGDEAAEAFRAQLQAFCNLYSFMAQVVPFSDVDLEKLYAFGRMLLKKLPRKGERTPPIDLSDDVALNYYRLEKVTEGDLGLSADGEAALGGPSETGTGAAKSEKERLSRLIDVVNERFGTDFDVQDLIDSVRNRLVDDEAIQRAARANDKANFSYVFNPALDGAFIECHSKNEAFVNELFSDAELLRYVRARMLDDVYDHIVGQEREAAGG